MLDMLFVGPNDLACSMGFRAADHENIPEVQEAIERIRKAAVSNGKYAGMFCTQPEQVSDGLPLSLKVKDGADEWDVI